MNSVRRRPNVSRWKRAWHPTLAAHHDFLRYAGSGRVASLSAVLPAPGGRVVGGGQCVNAGPGVALEGAKGLVPGFRHDQRQGHSFLGAVFNGRSWMPTAVLPDEVWPDREKRPCGEGQVLGDTVVALRLQTAWNLLLSSVPVRERSGASVCGQGVRHRRQPPARAGHLSRVIFEVLAGRSPCPALRRPVQPA